MEKKIYSFTQLLVWKKAHMLVLELYKVTKIFPKEEKYGLVDQLRRAAISITSNIAEGFSKRTSKDKNHFYGISLGSLAEVQSQLLIARDLAYLSEGKFQTIAHQTVEIHKMMNGLMKSSKTKGEDIP